MYFKLFTRLFVLLFIITVVSCNDPIEDERWGEMSLSSAFDFTTSSLVGYNYELESYARFPSSVDPFPDIILDKFTKPDGEIFPGFSSPGNDAGFALVSESGTLPEALDAFNQLQEFNEASALSPTTDTIRLYQVWVLKTSLENYTKMVVKDIRYLQNLSGDYIKVDLEYYYQDDGSPAFEKR